MSTRQAKILPIAEQGEPILHERAQLVTAIGTPEIQQLIDDMHLTMQEANGVGIAAPQVFQPWRIIIVASRPNSRYPNAPEMKPVAMINPEIIWRSKYECTGWEGCLSVPDTRAQVHRAERLQIRYFSRQGNPVEKEYEGFIARIIQHECDHLDGVLFPERVEDKTRLVDEATFQALTTST